MKYLVASLLVLSMLVANPLANTIQIDTKGSGVIANADISKARSDAMTDAIKKAVTTAIKRYVPDQKFQEHRSTLNENIYKKALGYIQQLDIQSEGLSQQQPENYDITLSIKFLIENLEKDLIGLAVINESELLPELFVFVQEKNIENVHWHFKERRLNYSEQTILQLLGERGFQVNDQTAFIDSISPELERAFYTEDMSTILNASEQTGAEIIIIGKAISRSSREKDRISGEYSLQASVNLEAYQIHNGRLIASGSGVSDISHGDELAGGQLSITQSSTLASNELIANLLDSSRENMITGISITLIINGLRSIEDLITFQKEFESTAKGLKSMERRTFAGGMAAYDVVSSVDGLTMADLLTVNGLNSFNVKVRSKSPGSLELNLDLSQ